jgi:hypothetical protein
MVIVRWKLYPLGPQGVGESVIVAEADFVVSA